GVNVLIDGVGGPLVPLFVEALLRRQDVDVFVEFPAQVAPARGYMAVETASLVLRKDKNAAQVAVDAVGQGEIDDAVEAAEGDRRLGAIACQRFQTRPLAAGKDHGQDVSHPLLGTRAQNRAGPSSYFIATCMPKQHYPQDAAIDVLLA